MSVFEARRSGRRTLYIYALPTASGGRNLPGGPAKAVYDGDTLRAIFPGTQGLRFLGCDTAEMAYAVPTSPTAFKGNQKIGGPLWDAYLTDPLAPGAWPAFPGAGLHPVTETRLRAATGPGCAANHARHADRAKQALIDIMTEDQMALGIPDDAFRLFAVIAHEVLDGYGRPLVFVNTEEKDPARRPKLTYNERLIARGAAAPFFIWPNVDPFRERPRITDAALPPPDMRRAARTGKLARSRADAAAARAAGLGIWDPADPLRLLPYELRMLGDRRLPSRWVIDLSAPDDDATLYPPEAYPLIPNPEDRLFIPEEYVPLFAAKGWRPGLLVRF
jgi:endonuclease YncB( thermonuclease family)